MKSHWRELAQLIGLDVPIWKVGAFDYLESEGLRFCYHFGIDNAIDMARQHYAEHKHTMVIH